jgi:thiosulfate dehydrogenase
MKDSFQPILKMLTLMVGLLLSVTLLTAVLIGAIVMVFTGGSLPPLNQTNTNEIQTLTATVTETYRGVVPKEGLWVAPEWSSVDQEPNAEDIKYGKELIANTATYLGPTGKVRKISNGMNCQNCHLNAGTAPLGNNYSAVASTYPKVRARSGQMEDVEKRINDCFERRFRKLRYPSKNRGFGQ